MGIIFMKQNILVVIVALVLGQCFHAEARSVILGGSTSQRGNALSRHYQLTSEEIRTRVKTGMKFPEKGEVYTTEDSLPMFCECKERDGKYYYYGWEYYGSVGSCYSDTQTYQALQESKKQADDFAAKRVEERAAFIVKPKEPLVVKKMILPSSPPSSSRAYNDKAKQRKYASEYTKYLQKAIILVERVNAGDDEPRAGFVSYADLKRKCKK